MVGGCLGRGLTAVQVGAHLDSVKAGPGINDDGKGGCLCFGGGSNISRLRDEFNSRAAHRSEEVRGQEQGSIRLVGRRRVIPHARCLFAS